MNHPDDPVEQSVAGSGDVQNVPDCPISVVVTDAENNPAGLLEKWDTNSWIYASSDCLQALEPEPPDGESY